MSNRNTSENSDSISLFPFLAVLLCTMGALLVMLVVFVQQAAERALLPDANPLQLKAAQHLGSDHTAENAAAQQELAEIARYRQQLDGLQVEGARRLDQEQQRLSHSEEHARRLQEELAKIGIAAEQLRQTEANQSVDQQQAEAEMKRLEQLVLDTNEQIEKLRQDQVSAKRSFAIIPYKGPNGTYRKPIYIECSEKGVMLHPEGVLLTANDFVAPNWPGNPLAAALRASREYLNDKAAKAGQRMPPDPYPLIIVRPSGIAQYSLARAAITSWDADYGYEFVAEEMKLSFPESPDPQLARVQQHAVMNSRDRLLHLVQSAPSRFRGMKVGGGSMSGGGESTNVQTDGYGSGEYGRDGSSLVGRAGPAGTETVGAGVKRYSGGDQSVEKSSAETDAETDEPQIGNLATGSAPGRISGETSTSAEGNSQPVNNGATTLAEPRFAQQGSQGNTQGQGSPNNAPSELLQGKDQANGSGSNQLTASSGASSGGDSNTNPSVNFSSSTTQSIADSRGANWAVNQPRQKSVPIRRPIQVAVHKNKMILLKADTTQRSKTTNGQEISLDQPIHEISDNFTKAVRERIDDWGLAGSGMYWRPVLELSVEADATMTAARIAQLLQDSGVEVQLPATAAADASRPRSVGGTLR